MNNLQVSQFNWIVQNGKAFADGTGYSFICFLDPGNYAGSELQIKWQFKLPKEDWWDNMTAEPTGIFKAKYDIRQIITLADTSRSDDETPMSFQNRVLPWLIECFGVKIASNQFERGHRFLEEAIELVQSIGVTREEAYELVDYVFDRPTGEPDQEVGGVMVTLAGLCLAAGLNMDENAETELSRLWQPEIVEKVKRKRANKPYNSPLPGR